MSCKSRVLCCRNKWFVVKWLVSCKLFPPGLQEKDVKYRSTNLKLLLSEKHVEKRLKWAHDNTYWYQLVKCFVFRLGFLLGMDSSKASRVKKTSLGESLAGSHAYNPIRDSRRDSWRDFLARKVSLKVSPRVSARLSARLLARLSPRLVFFTRDAWSCAESRMLQRTVKHPIKLHVWGCLREQGFGCLHVFTKNLNAQKMVKIYQKGLLRSTKQWFGDDNDSWILQEDNDPKHRSLLCKRGGRKMGYRRWIENVWGVLKVGSIPALHLKTFEQLFWTTTWGKNSTKTQWQARSQYLCYCAYSVPFAVPPVPRKLDQTILFLSLSHLWLFRWYSVGN